jgi:uncharacterized protein YjbI with pentapeptide repeats
MCSHTYTVPEKRHPRPNGNRCPYPALYESRSTTLPDARNGAERPVLPIDSDGMCIFHSRQIEWKRENNFNEKFRELLRLLDESEQRYDFVEFAFVGDEVRGKGAKQENVLRVTDRVFRRSLDFEGASFHDSVEFHGVTFEQGVGFRWATFFHDLEFSRVRSRNFDFIAAQFNGAAFFIGVDCTNQAFFDDARFTSTADDFAAKFEDVNFRGFVTFPGASFRLGSESAVRFRNVVFEDVVDFTNTLFQCHVSFENASFASRADFIDTSFESRGSTARFRGAAVEFKKIAVAANGVLTFMCTDPNNKMFSDDVIFGFREEPEGRVRFENVNFNRLTVDSRERLILLAKTGRVEIGSGCIKYRFQTGIRTILIDGSNQPLIVEICQTFTNYFTASNGLNLGFEIVERDRSKVSFFYFTDEDISGEEFLERLERTEARMWNLLSANPDGRSLGPEGVSDITTSSKRKTSVINAVDVISALIGIFFRVGARVALGAWTVRDTKALLGGIRFNDIGADDRAESLHQVLANKYTGQTLFDLNDEQNQLLPPIVGPDTLPGRQLFAVATRARQGSQEDREQPEACERARQSRFQAGAGRDRGLSHAGHAG